MAKYDPRVDAYIRKAAPFARPILKRLREVVHAGCAEVEEAIKWSFPHFLHHGLLCSMAAFNEHCAFGFWKASRLDIKSKAGAMGQFGRITSVEDLPPRRELVRFVRQAAALNERGVKAPRPARPAKPHVSRSRGARPACTRRRAG